jgi:hypothetical protein
MAKDSHYTPLRRKEQGKEAVPALEAIGIRTGQMRRLHDRGKKSRNKEEKL